MKRSENSDSKVPHKYTTKPPPFKKEGVLDRKFFAKNLRCTDSIHTGSTNWTFPFHCGFAIFHGDFDGLRIFALCATFDTIH